VSSSTDPAWTALREALRAGPVAGTFLKLPATEVVDLAAAAFDFAVVDLEHSQLDELEARRLVRHAWALGFPVVVRLPLADRGLVNRLLEAGAAGIQLSTVRTAAAVTSARDSLRYAPAGSRSISLAQGPAGYGGTGLADFLAAEGEGPLLVAQIETASTDDPLEEIAAAGPDVLFVGPLDLTVDLGLDRDRVRARRDEIAAAATAAGIPLGGVAIDDHPLQYDVVGSDLALLRGAFVEAAAERKDR
jgi:4-hydroxy-2-oxoheptanedioate aldolase